MPETFVFTGAELGEFTKKMVVPKRVTRYGSFRPPGSRAGDGTPRMAQLSWAGTCRFVLPSIHVPFPF